MSPTQHFLLIHHRASNETTVRDFGEDEQAAMDAYEREEASHMDDDNYDVVLVGSESEEALRVTHASYFAPRSGRRDIAGVPLRA